MAKDKKAKSKWYVGTTSYGRVIALPESALEALEETYHAYQSADDDEKQELAYDDGLPVPAPENIMADIDFPACISEFVDFESNMAGYAWAEVPSKHLKTVVERLREADYEVVENYHFPEPDDVSW